MSRVKRSFTPEERLSLLQEAEREGYMETCRKYNLSPSLLAKWKPRYQAKGSEGLKPAYKRVDPEVRALEEENERLKRIIAKEAFHSILQRELIERFEFSSYYEAKQHIEKYMQWYNYERKHRKLGRITPHQKWTTGLSCSTDKQRGQVAGAGVSRPNDSIKNQTQNHSLCTSLDSADSDTYFCLEVEQENRKALHIVNNDSVQLIGG